MDADWEAQFPARASRQGEEEMSMKGIITEANANTIKRMVSDIQDATVAFEQAERRLRQVVAEFNDYVDGLVNEKVTP